MTKYIALVFLFLVPLSIAHLEGESQTAGGYKIELSTLPEELMTWKNSDIIIAIENATTGERVPGAVFWARLSLNGTAILSSNFDLPIRKNVCFAGEVGLSGEIRSVNRLEQRIAEAEKLGFDSIFISKAGKGINLRKFKIEILQFDRVDEFFRHVFSKKE